MTPLNFYNRHELTRYLTSGEVDILERALSRVLPGSIDQLCLDLEGGAPFQGEFWSSHEYTEWPFVALAALKAERCTIDQFATISLLYAALKEFVYTETIHSFGSSGWQRDFNPSKKIDGAPFRVVDPASPKYEKYLQCFFKWDEERIATLKSNLTKKPLADQCLFVISMPKGPIEYWGPMIKAIEIATYGSLYPLKEKQSDILGITQKRNLILPSCSALKSFFDLIDPVTPTSIIPRLGTMTELNIIQDRFRFSHVLALQVEGLFLPSSADGRPTGPFTFGMHDIYHTYNYARYCSREFLFITNRIIQVLCTEPENPELVALRAKLIDSEFVKDVDVDKVLVGSLFTHPYLKASWEVNGGAYKKRVLEDMARYKPFWDYFCHAEMGLSDEDMALVPLYLSPTFPPVKEMTDLGIDEVLCVFFEMAQALKWNVSQINKGMSELSRSDVEIDDAFKRIFPTESIQKEIALEVASCRYLFCIQLFQTLPRAKSLEEIAFIIEAPLSMCLFLMVGKELILDGKSTKILSFIISPHFDINFNEENINYLKVLLKDSWDDFEQLVMLLSRSHEKALNEGSFTLDELMLILERGQEGVLGGLLEQTKHFDWSKKEMIETLSESWRCNGALGVK
ncbi:MAG: hypothetical protein KBC64_00260 [Simkaniaceae bacterium]|nr:hypothetical protein [Simkaniaceae bacterium]